MPSPDFEPTIPAFERVKTVMPLDCATTVIGIVTYANVKSQVISRGKPDAVNFDTEKNIMQFGKVHRLFGRKYVSIFMVKE
jgi:hypothetical protein